MARSVATSACDDAAVTPPLSPSRVLGEAAPTAALLERAADATRCFRTRARGLGRRRDIGGVCGLGVCTRHRHAHRCFFSWDRQAHNRKVRPVASESRELQAVCGHAAVYGDAYVGMATLWHAIDQHWCCGKVKHAQRTTPGSTHTGCSARHVPDTPPTARPNSLHFANLAPSLGLTGVLVTLRARCCDTRDVQTTLVADTSNIHIT